MLTRAASALVVILSGAALFAADPPKIAGPDKVDPYRLAKFSVTGLGPDDSVLWKVRPLDAVNDGKVDFTAGGNSGQSVEWVAPPGKYRVEVIIARPVMGKFTLAGDEKIVTIGPGAPAPKPDPKPKPDPVPPPKPKPDPTPEPDAALVLKFKPAVKDADKANVVALGKVYYTTGVLLETLKDPAARPKTFRDVVDRLTDASIAAMIPRLPELSDLRKLISAELGDYDAMMPVTDEFAKELATKYKRVGLALQSAGK
jgi:hypothetical protein